MTTQVSEASSITAESLFMEPKLPDFDILAKSDEAFPDLPSLDINDLPAMDVMSESFRATCASTKVVNEFLDLYNVAFQDRISLIKGILAMTHGASATMQARMEAAEKEKYLATGGKEYYGMYL